MDIIVIILKFLDVPIFVSKPHFLDADKYYSNDINGPSSNRDKHDSFLNVEPVRRRRGREGGREGRRSIQVFIILIFNR